MTKHPAGVGAALVAALGNREGYPYTLMRS